ncbi:conjugative transfer signal peptidase TraF, partial [Xanthomonas citri pv. citri]|nr:conjugative transfer signal peptidase TraF [Xanthomonas citri pv. citri]
ARLNTSKSIPLGLYWTSSAPVTKGEYVIFCPPQRPVFDDARERGYIGSGFCPGNYGYMMKRVLAAKGDTVSVTPQGVTVNG